MDLPGRQVDPHLPLARRGPRFHELPGRAPLGPSRPSAEGRRRQAARIPRSRCKRYGVHSVVPRAPLPYHELSTGSALHLHRKDAMYALRTKYLASAFLDIQSLSYSQKNIDGIRAALLSSDFTPAPLSEPGPGGVVQRMGFLIPQTGWVVAIRLARIDVVVQPTTLDRDLPDLATFCASARQYLTGVLAYLGRGCHRLALVQEGLLKEMGEPEKSRIARRLLKLPSRYSRSEPFEWDWRVVCRQQHEIGGQNEQTNEIAIVKRRSGKLGENNFDRIAVDLDINTSPVDERERFGESGIHEFIDQARGWHADLETELSCFLETDESA